MNNNDIQKVEKGRKIAKHILRLMRNGKNEPDSQEAIRQFAEENRYAKGLYDRMSDESYLENAVENHRRNEETEQAEQFVREGMRNIKHKSRLRVLFYTVSSAAAMIALGIFFFWPTDDSADKLMLASGQTEAPVIISDSGDTISLLGAAQAIQIGNTLVEHIQKENKIVYSDNVTTDTIVEYHTLNIPRRSTYTVVLADKTEVTLNAGSRLTYPKQFIGKERKVVLGGEGYFVVTKSEAPFIVSTEKFDIHVLGTTFNINLNKKESLETFLAEGSIQVNFKNQQQAELTMTPGQLFTLNVSTGDYDLQNVDDEAYLGWRSRSFKTQKEPLSNLTDQISTWYGVEFTYTRPAMKMMPVSVLIDKNLEISQVIAIMEALTECEIINKGGTKYEIK
jgi:ferric-dicitrate binding protein FerR (iron transport regulator)